MFVRRDRPSTSRFIVLRVALFFLAAGLWLGGVIVENDVVTGFAIGIVVAALILGIVARRTEDPPEEELT